MTTRKSSPVVSPSTLYGDPNKSYGPQFLDTVYIFDVNGARKVKSDAQVAKN